MITLKCLQDIWIWKSSILTPTSCEFEASYLCRWHRSTRDELNWDASVAVMGRPFNCDNLSLRIWAQRQVDHWCSNQLSLLIDIDQDANFASRPVAVVAAWNTVPHSTFIFWSSVTRTRLLHGTRIDYCYVGNGLLLHSKKLCLQGS